MGSPTPDAPRRSMQRRRHFLYAYWKAVATLATVLSMTFLYSVFVRGAILDSIRARILLPEGGLSQSEKIEYLSMVLGYDVGGSPLQQFVDFLTTHGGLPLATIFVIGGSLAFALEWRYGILR